MGGENCYTELGDLEKHPIVLTLGFTRYMALKQSPTPENRNTEPVPS